MAPADTDRFLDRVAVASIWICVLAVALTVFAFSAPALADRLGWIEPVASYAVGDHIDLDSGVYASSSRTVVLFVRSSCGACEASRSVMAAIAADLQAVPTAHVVMVTSKIRSIEEAAFARDVGIDESRLWQVDMSALRLRYVPTMVLTDAEGTVLMAREGLLTESDRRDVVQMIVDRRPD